MTELEARKFADLDAIRAPTLGGRLTRWRTALGNAWHELRKSRTASIGAVMLVLLFGACIATPWITTYDPIKQNYRERLQPPSEKHLLGTDRMGRDIYSRLLWGGRRLVTIALLAVTFWPLHRHPLRRAVGLFRRQGRHRRACASSTGFWPFPASSSTC